MINNNMIITIIIIVMNLIFDIINIIMINNIIGIVMINIFTIEYY